MRNECLVLSELYCEFTDVDPRDGWAAAIKELEEELEEDLEEGDEDDLFCFWGSENCVIMSSNGAIDQSKVRAIFRKHGIGVKLDHCRITQR